MAGSIAGMLSNRKMKPSLRVTAFVDSYPNETAPMEDIKYLKEDFRRVRAEVVAIKKALDSWVPEDVAARAEKSLRDELKRKKSRLVELNARLDALEEDDEDETEEEEED